MVDHEARDLGGPKPSRSLTRMRSVRFGNDMGVILKL